LGLEHMHLQVGTLNRDLKPENVVLNGNMAKLTDFGFSKICDDLEDLSQSGWTFNIPTGSPGYCPPEILSKQAYGMSAFRPTT